MNNSSSDPALGFYLKCRSEYGLVAYSDLEFDALRGWFQSRRPPIRRRDLKKWTRRLARLDNRILRNMDNCERQGLYGWDCARTWSLNTNYIVTEHLSLMGKLR